MVKWELRSLEVFSRLFQRSVKSVGFWLIGNHFQYNMTILGGLKFGYMFACQIVTEAGTRMVMLLNHINHNICLVGLVCVCVCQTVFSRNVGKGLDLDPKMLGGG